MKRKILLVGIGWLAIGGKARAADQTARQLLDALPTQIRAEADAKRNGKLPQNVGQADPNYLLSFFRNAREALDNGDEASATQQIRQLEYAAATDPTRDACEAFVNRLRKEHTDREEAANAEVAATMQRAGEAVLKARTPQDLDATLHELAVASEKRVVDRAFERGNDTASNRLPTIVKFVTRWQDYLLALNRNDTRTATEQLRSLVSETDVFQWLRIPRSEVVSRIPPVNPPVVESTPTPAPKRVLSSAEINAVIETALDRLKTLDDIAPVLHDLRAFSRDLPTISSNYGNNANDLNNILSSLEELQDAYLEVQAGVNRWQGAWFTHFNNTGGPQRGRKVYIDLRAQLFALTLPRILGSPETENTEKPAPGERVDDFLERLIVAARKRADWPAVARGIECRHYLATNAAYESNPAEYSNEAAAFKAFFSGQNFEQAAQYEQAVAGYLSSLASGSQEIPVALISERLAAIKKAHPVEYAGGVRAISLPGLENYRGLGRFYRSEAPSAPPDSDDAPEGTVLSAPSPTPAPTPTPTPIPSTTPKPSP